MDLGNKIKQLRNKSGLTQNQLATILGVSSQAISKWENSITLPEITLLPQIAIEFGISIDELFDLTLEQKLERIEKSIDVEEELSIETFKEYEFFLKERLEEDKNNPKIISLLANLYHHRMESDSKKVSKYAFESIKLEPHKKDCQWLLNKAEGQIAWDWNIFEHSKLIDFYKEVIESDKVIPPTPLPYYYLLDALIIDHRTKEAKKYLEILKTIPSHKPFLITVYNAHIALAEFNEEKADLIIEEGIDKYFDNSSYLFEAAQYYAKKCNYEKALELYERSWKFEENSKPRYTDTLYGIAKIYKIMGKKEKVIQTYDRIINLLKDEWGYNSDDRTIHEVEIEKNNFISHKK